MRILKVFIDRMTEIPYREDILRRSFYQGKLYMVGH